jgi:hypothetical protein
VKRRLHATALLAVAIALPALAGLGMPGASAGDVPNVWIDPTGQQADYTQGTFDIVVILSNLEHHGSVSYDTDRDGQPDRVEPSNGLGAYELKLRFNPDVVKVTHMEAGEFLRSGGRSATCLQNNATYGVFALGCVSTGGSTGPQGDGNLAVITLEPVANGTTYLQLEAGLAGPLGDTIDVTSDSGIVEVRNGPNKPPPTSGPVGTQPTLPPNPGQDGEFGTDDDPPYTPGIVFNAQGTPVPVAELTPFVSGQPTTRPGDDPSDPVSAGGTDDDSSGGGAMTWILVAVVGIVGLGVLGGVSRLVIRGRASA